MFCYSNYGLIRELCSISSSKKCIFFHLIFNVLQWLCLIWLCVRAYVCVCPWRQPQSDRTIRDCLMAHRKENRGHITQLHSWTTHAMCNRKWNIVAHIFTPIASVSSSRHQTHVELTITYSCKTDDMLDERFFAFTVPALASALSEYAIL